MSLVKRTTSILSANAISMGLVELGGSPHQYLIKNLSTAGISLFIADQTTAGTAPTTSTNIPVDCSNYWTVSSGEEQYIATANPLNVFVQVSSGTSGIAQATKLN